MTEIIHPEAHMGAVSLTVTDLTRSMAFYTDRLGFDLHNRENRSAALGAGGNDLVYLHEKADAKRIPHTTGLYHFAILVPSRVALARSIAHVARTKTPVTGFADHNVSEAMYLPDPDGNGIEIYRDRPREEWQYVDDRLQLGTYQLDIEAVLRELNESNNRWTGLEAETMMGHMHLHVSNIPEAEGFYQEVIGFERMARYGPSASFLAAGGYHHHLGINTWAGSGIPAPPPDAVGLDYYTIMLPDQQARGAIIRRAEKVGVRIEERAGGLFMRDPAGNGIVLM